MSPSQAHPPSGAPAADRMSPVRARLEAVALRGPPGLRAFAAWLVERPEELAFRSVRGLAEAAGCDANVVVRTMKAAGFAGFAEGREAVRQALRQPATAYVARAEALRDQPARALLADLAAAEARNAADVYGPGMAQALAELVPHLLSARRVQAIGVRMGFALAHYFTYRGAIAHPHVVPAPAQPGLILDSLAGAGPEDVVLVISFAHYSAEAVRAARVASAQGARVLALTDRPGSPLVAGAWRVLLAPVAGPNVMYTLSGALLILEALLELMAAADPGARARVDDFERRLLALGAYVGPDPAPESGAPRRRAR